jgi:hypothetical protein
LEHPADTFEPVTGEAELARRYHLAGSLGAAVTSRLIELDWLRLSEASRVVRLTATGQRGLGEWLKVDLPGRAAS